MNVIRIKRRVKTDPAGAPDNLANAELAFNEADNTLYYGRDDDGSGNAVDIIPIAGDGMAETVEVPQEDGTASCGDAFTVSRSDHIHPTDTSRAPIDSPTFTGTVTLPGDPTQPLEAATKQYVDVTVGDFLPLTGGTLSGPLLLAVDDPAVPEAGDPTSPVQAASKHYVDNVDNLKLNKFGDTMTNGWLTLHADPVNPMEAATKQYVDSAAAVSDAPSDTYSYGRKDATWSQVMPLVGGQPPPSETGSGLVGTDVVIRSGIGDGAAPGGRVWLIGADAPTVPGNVELIAGSLTGPHSGPAGRINLRGGNATPGAGSGSGGSIYLTGGGAEADTAGGIRLEGGPGNNTASAGAIDIFGGSASGSGLGGHIRMVAGQGSEGGDIIIQSGSGTEPGNITLMSGAGNIVMIGLSTAARNNPEAIWNNNGVLNIGAGSTSDEYLPLTGGTLSGPLLLAEYDSSLTDPDSAADPVEALQAASKHYVDHVDNMKLNKFGDTMTNGWLTLYADPVNPMEAATKQYVDAADALFAPIESPTFTGIVTLPVDPAQPLEAATKQYVDATVGQAGYLPLTGGTLSGALLLAEDDPAVPEAGDPTSPVQAASKHYVDHVDNMKLNKFGDTMTNGWLTLYADPVNPMEAATKAYVDAVGGAVEKQLADYLPLSGGDLSGTLTLFSDPVELLEAATKAYVDTAVAPLANYLPLVGGTLTGPLLLAADPVAPEEAATKHYVDHVDNMKLNKFGDIMTGPLVLSGDPVQPLEAVTKQYVDAIDTALDEYLPLTGGILTGDLLIKGNASADRMTLANPPVLPLEATSKAYVDAATRNAGLGEAPIDTFSYGRKDETWVQVLPLTGGGIIDGNVTIDGNASVLGSLTTTEPIYPEQVATKGYVDSQMTTSTVSPSDALPLMDKATGLAGILDGYSREDHVHPTDTSRAPLASPTFTGVVTLPADPAQPLEAATKAYVDTVAGGLDTKLDEYLPLTGGNLSGTLTLAADPITVLEAATKQYVDTGDTASDTLINEKVAKAGDTMTGPLILYADPTDVLEAVTKQYVDAADTTFATKTYVDAADALLAPIESPTFTGTVTLPGDPTIDLGAVTKQYVDAIDPTGIYLPLAGGTMEGALTLVGNPTNPLTAATKQYVDSAVGYYLLLAGGVMTGPVTLAADAALPLEPVTLQQMQAQVFSDAPSDTFFYGRQDGKWIQGLPLTGGVIAGDLVITGDTLANGTLAAPDPILPQQVATKAYVDTALVPMADYLPLAGGVLTGNLVLETAAITGQDGVAGALGGSVNITAGLGDAGGGAVTIVGGAAPAGPGGPISIIGGDAQSDLGGSITFTPGIGSVKHGSIILDRNSAMADKHGDIILRNLPTSAPVDTDAIWNNLGIINIGAGGTGGGLADAPSDGVFYGRRNAGWVEGMPLSGGVMTGELILFADALLPLEAVTLQQLEASAFVDAPNDAFSYGRRAATWDMVMPLMGGSPPEETAGDGATIIITGGATSSVGGTAGDVKLEGGTANAAGTLPGNIVLQPGSDSGQTVFGDIIIPNLPTTIPAEPDAMWNNLGVLNIGASIAIMDGGTF